MNTGPSVIVDSDTHHRQRSTAERAGQLTGNGREHRPLDPAALQLTVLEALAGAHNYNAWIVSLTVPHLGAWPLEIGSGLGDHAEAWLAAGVERVTVSDHDQAMLTRLSNRFHGAWERRIDVVQLNPLDPPERSHTAVVAVNVLEHIEDDVGALRGARRLVRPGGKVVIFAPAHEWAMSAFDKNIGHVRRYTVGTLRHALRAGGWEPVDVRYINPSGLVAWLVGMKVLRLVPSDGAVLAAWDRIVVPISRRVEEHVRMPFGQSVFAVGRRQG
jgi:SAM-dependent methyltransferase